MRVNFDCLYIVMIQNLGFYWHENREGVIYDGLSDYKPGWMQTPPPQLEKKFRRSMFTLLAQKPNAHNDRYDILSRCTLTKFYIHV